MVFNKLYKVKFVPIKNSQGKYVPGLYVIKIIVEPGKSKETYCFKMTESEGYRVCFRTENEVLMKQPNVDFLKIIEFVRNRVENPREGRVGHEGECPDPEIGKTLCN